MPESRGRRPKTRSPPPKTYAANKTTKTENKETTLPASAKSQSRFLDKWKDVWAILGPIFALISLVVGSTGITFLLWPQIQIEPSANLDPSQPLSTQFRVTNVGRTVVYNVVFGCEYGFPFQSGNFSMIGSAIEPVQRLSPNRPITRSCAVSSAGVETPNLRITTRFEWPVIAKQDSASGFFRVVRGQDSYFLLPDDPPPGWRSAISIASPGR
jgi:hypothetical protein